MYDDAIYIFAYYNTRRDTRRDAEKNDRQFIGFFNDPSNISPLVEREAASVPLYFPIIFMLKCNVRSAHVRACALSYYGVENRGSRIADIGTLIPPIGDRAVNPDDRA